MKSRSSFVAKFFRRLRGGYWVLYDNAGHGSSAPDSWERVSKVEFDKAKHELEHRDSRLTRVRAVESYE